MRKEIAVAKAQIPQAEAAVDEASEALATGEVAHILDGGPPPSAKANKALTDARDHLNSLETRIRGLRTALDKSDDAFLAASADLVQTREDMTRELDNEFR